MTSTAAPTGRIAPDRIEIHPSVVFTALDETESALLHLDTKRYYSINETGTRVWQLLADGLDPAAIGETLCREFEVDPEGAARYVAAFFDELAREGLVRR